MAYNIVYNGLSNKTLGVEVVKRPIIPIPNKNFNTFNITGQDGNFFEDLETYEDIEIEISFNFVNEVKDIRNKIRKIKKWLENITDNKLILSDNRGRFYKVKKAELNNFSYDDLYEIQNFTIKFTVDPYEYLDEGLEEITLGSELQNDYSVSKPIYRIEGNGECELTVNDNTIKCTVDSGGININTDLGLIYKNDGTYATNKVKIEEFKDLYLLEDNNTFNWTNGFNVYLIPNFKII